MITHALLIVALAILTLVYCGAKTVADIRARRSFWVFVGVVITTCAPIAIWATASFVGCWGNGLSSSPYPGL